jgi:uncharacterized tellurite resistance protein B-like protein
MHIVAGLIAILGTLGLILYRLSQAGAAARDVADVASEVKGWMRKRQWQTRTHVDEAREVIDPRLAATTMMAAIAADDGPLTERQQTKIFDFMALHFAMSGDEASEMLAQSRWLAREVGDLSSYLIRLIGPIHNHCTDDEKRHLIDMLTAVAGVQNQPNSAQEQAINGLAQRLI